MNEICLQHILFPKIDICTEEGLYYRGEEKVRLDYKEEMLELFKNEMVDFGTYFNSFSYGLWKKYTYIDNVNLRISIKGKINLKIYQVELVNDIILPKVLKSVDLESDEKKDFFIEIDVFDIKGQIGFRIEALEDNVHLYGGEYYTKCENEIVLPKMAVDICTYHREEYVYRNFRNIKKYIQKNENSILEQQVDFYIIDNGESLEEKKLAVPNVNVIKQRDSGATGGFTRGMIEIINNKKIYYDDILLMDDDILFEPEIIERTCLFKAFIKKEYEDCILGGGNLDLGIPWRQHESGGFFDEYGYTILGLFFDLRNPYFLLRNECEKNAMVSAWWYCCLPRKYVRNNNLPYPFFFHREDMEYSYRSKRQVILLNGIGVWHESFFNKQPAWQAYYDTRNLLILDTLHFSDFTKHKAKKILFKAVIDSIIKYRYKETEFVIQAYKDYLKGPQWMEEYDDADYLEEKIEESYHIGEINTPLDYNLYERRMYYVESKWRKILRKLTLNGYLLPSNKDVIAPMHAYDNYISFRARMVVNYDFIRQRGYITYRSHKEAIKGIWKMVKMFIALDFKFNTIQKKYRENFSQAVTLEAWKKKLNMQ